MANLVVCCDGTWNTPDQTDGGLPAPTNVPRLFNALAATDERGGEQKKYYHSGVGLYGAQPQRDDRALRTPGDQGTLA